METQSGETKQEPIVIKVRPVKETPREKEIIEVAKIARQTALEKLSKTSDSTDFLRWHRATSVYFTPANIAWIWDYGGTTPEDLIAEQESKEFTESNAKNAQAAETLKTNIDTLQPQEGMIRVGLKRVRDRNGNYQYRVLAAFPKGTHVSDPLDESADQQRSEENIIFFEPETACVNHACDDLYKTHRDSAFYMPDKTLSEAIRGLQTNKQGANEYLLEKTEADSVKQDAENYILVGLLGGYSNERLRVRISDFWKRYSTSKVADIPTTEKDPEINSG